MRLREKPSPEAGRATSGRFLLSRHGPLPYPSRTRTYFPKTKAGTVPDNPLSLYFSTVLFASPAGRAIAYGIGVVLHKRPVSWKRLRDGILRRRGSSTLEYHGNLLREVWRPP